MKRFIAMVCSLVTFASVYALAYPPATASNCAPYDIFHAPTGAGEFGWNDPLTGEPDIEMISDQGSGGGFYATNRIAWRCPTTEITGKCTPCFKAYLYKDTTWISGTSNPSDPGNWVNMNKPQTYFWPSSTIPEGTCGVGGGDKYRFKCDGLPPGRYRIYVEYGAGSDAKCYILRSTWMNVIVPT